MGESRDAPSVVNAKDVVMKMKLDYSHGMRDLRSGLPEIATALLHCGLYLRKRV